MANGNPFFVQPGGSYGPGLQELAGTLMQAQQMRQQSQQRKQQELQQDYVNSMFDAVNNPEQIPTIAQNLKMRLGQAGAQPQQLQQIDMFMELYNQDPDEAVSRIEKQLAFSSPQRYQALKQAISQPTTDLTSNQKDYLLAKKEGFEGSYMDYRKALGADPAQDLEMQKLKLQIADINQRHADRLEDKRIKKELSTKKDKSLVANIDNIVEQIDKASDVALNSLTATGIPGAVTQIVPGSPSYNLRRSLDTIKANIGFDKLQQMRDASPTGGALGQVSEREINFLQSTIAALDPNMGDKELAEGLKKVRKHYMNWKKTLIGEMPDDSIKYESEDLREFQSLPLDKKIDSFLKDIRQ